MTLIIFLDENKDSNSNFVCWCDYDMFMLKLFSAYLGYSMLDPEGEGEWKKYKKYVVGVLLKNKISVGVSENFGMGIR